MGISEWGLPYMSSRVADMEDNGLVTVKESFHKNGGRGREIRCARCNKPLKSNMVLSGTVRFCYFCGADLNVKPKSRKPGKKDMRVAGVYTDRGQSDWPDVYIEDGIGRMHEYTGLERCTFENVTSDWPEGEVSPMWKCSRCGGVTISFGEPHYCKECGADGRKVEW